MIRQLLLACGLLVCARATPLEPFYTHDGDVTTVNKVEQGKVFYRKAGQHTFILECDKSEHLFWEVKAPGGGSAPTPVTIEIPCTTTADGPCDYNEEYTEYRIISSNVEPAKFLSLPSPFQAEGIFTVSKDNAADDDDDGTTTTTTTPTGNATPSHPGVSNNQYMLDGCPLRREREGWTAIELVTIAQFGSMSCHKRKDDDTNYKKYNITISSAAPFALQVGEDPEFADFGLMQLPYYYEAASSWAGYTSTYFLYLLVLQVMVLLYLMGKKRDMHHFVHASILAAFVVFFIADQVRFASMFRYSTDRTCDALDQNTALGPKASRDDGTTNAALLFGFGRFVVYAMGMYVACKKYENAGGDMMLWVSAIVAIAGYLLVVAGGAIPVLVFLFYLADAKKVLPDNMSASASSGGGSIAGDVFGMSTKL